MNTFLGLLVGLCAFFGILKSATAITCEEDPCLNRGKCTDLTGGGVNCTCLPDYGGKFCQIAHPCDPDPCKNGAKCNSCQEDGCGGGYSCMCPPGFNGVHCEYEPCKVNPCKNGGTCRITRYPNGYKCECPEPWVGTICTVKCDPGYCYNGGTCYASGNSLYCKCPPTHVGTRCQYRDYCYHNTSPCKNNGTCHPSVLRYTDPINTMSHYCCHCTANWLGVHCEEEACSPSPCVHGTCYKYEHGVCHNGTNACRCPPEWFGDKCQYPNPCISSPCQNGGRCYPKLDGDGNPMYYCDCPLSYGGYNCEKMYAAECRMWCDPYYITFDGLQYGHQGSCRQILAKTCTNKWPVEKIPALQVWAEHRKCANGGASCPWKVGFDIYGIDVILELGKGVSIDWRGMEGRPTGIEEIPLDKLPWPQDEEDRNHFPLYITVDPFDPIRTLTIQFRGHDDSTTDPGYVMDVNMANLRISLLLSHKLADIIKPVWNGQSPPAYLCGMCGDFNQKSGDDFLGRSTPSLGFLDTFLMQPITPAGCDPYLNNISGGKRRRKRAATDPIKQFEPCTDEAGQTLAKEKCAIINREDGPFGGDCYKKNTQRQSMYESCVNDVCFNITFLEEHLSAVASMCGRHEIEVGDWRTEMNLPFPCLRNQEYKRCIMKQCIPTCRNTRPCEDDTWKSACHEGCVCKEGYIWDEVSNQCVEPSKCGTTKFKFPNGVTWGGGVLYKQPVFKCCQKTEEELAEMMYCQHAQWCFEPGAKLVFGNCGVQQECMDNGKWNMTKMHGRQLNRDRVGQEEIRQECKACLADAENCDDFVFFKRLQKVEKKKEEYQCPKDEEKEERKRKRKERRQKLKKRFQKDEFRDLIRIVQNTEKDRIELIEEHVKMMIAIMKTKPILPCRRIPKNIRDKRCKVQGWCIKRKAAVVMGRCQGVCKCNEKGKFECSKFKSAKFQDKCMSDMKSRALHMAGKLPFLYKFNNIRKHKMKRLRRQR